MKENQQPLVSIIMNCFNGEKYLKQAINSIFSQSYTNWELIFIDNNSNDRSQEIALSFGKRVNYFKLDKTINLSSARKYGFSKITGEWLAFLDTDDYWFKNKLQVQINFLKNTDYIFCYSSIKEINTNDELIRIRKPRYENGPHLKNQLISFDINMVTPLIKVKALIDNNILFDENIVASEEYNLFIRLASKGDFSSIQDVLGAWRVGESTLTNKSIEYWFKDREYTIKQLIQENPTLEKEIYYEIKIALNRAKYYKARFLISKENWSEARKTLSLISTDSLIYFVLYCISYNKSLWNFFHNEKRKRRISQRLEKIYLLK